MKEVGQGHDTASQVFKRTGRLSGRVRTETGAVAADRQPCLL